MDVRSPFYTDGSSLKQNFSLFFKTPELLWTFPRFVEIFEFCQDMMIAGQLENFFEKYFFSKPALNMRTIVSSSVLLVLLELNQFKLLEEIGYWSRFDYRERSLFLYALEHCDSSGIMWLHGRGASNYWDVSLDLIKYEKYDILYAILKDPHVSVCRTEKAIIRAVEKNRLDVVKYLYQNNFPLSYKAFLVSQTNRYSEITQWLIDHNCPQQQDQNNSEEMEN